VCLGLGVFSWAGAPGGRIHWFFGVLASRGVRTNGGGCPVDRRASDSTFPPPCLPMADAGEKISPGSAKPDDSTAVNRPGGVKALLQQLNTKHSDSHVKLPDGTTLEASQPGRKFATPKKPAKWEVGGGGGSPAQSPADNGAAKGGGGGGASGVKARLAEIAAQYSSSHVQLPDGSTPSGKRPAANKEKPRDASSGVLNGGEDVPSAQVRHRQPQPESAGRTAPCFCPLRHRHPQPKPIETKYRAQGNHHSTWIKSVGHSFTPLDSRACRGS